MKSHVTSIAPQARAKRSPHVQRPFRFTQRRIAIAVQLFCALQAGQSFAGCVLDDTTLQTGLTNTSACSNASTFTISTTGSFLNSPIGQLSNTGTLVNFGKLDNQGAFTNSGTIESTGLFASTGSFTNTGTLTILSGSKALVSNTTNLNGGTLSGGQWIVDSGAKDQASLQLGNGTLTTNQADITLLGAGASFTGLNNLQENAGTLTVGNGANFTSATLHNTGTLTAASGGTVTIMNDSNLFKGTLTGGTWVVEDTGTLMIGSGNIITNAADVRLSGANASFSQLGGMKSNTGTLTLTDGATLNKAIFTNTGTLIVGAGSSLSLNNNQNVGGTLTGGTWVVDDGTLVVGSGNITTNAADVTLIGQNARFAQLQSLTSNQGALTIGDGATFATQTGLFNTGTLTTLRGGTFRANQGIENDGVIDNGGTLSVTGKLYGGTFNNSGTLNVTIDGDVRIAQSSNLLVADVNQSKTPTAYDLAGGTWIVGTNSGAKPAGTGGASLIFGNGSAIRRVGAGTSISLIGPDAVINDLKNLESNAGALSFSNGANFTGVIGRNTGTVTAMAGSVVDIYDTKSLNKGTLSEGIWRVDSSGINGDTTRLRINDGEAILVNQAQIELHGSSKAGNAFAQMAGLQTNAGTLIVADGASYSSSAALLNTGTVTVANGGVVNISNSKNLSISGPGNVLTGGTWIVNDGTLVIGSQNIVTNAARIELQGLGSNFSQINGLRNNTGTLVVSNGASYETNKSSLLNTGTLVAASGGSIALSNSGNFSNGVLTGGTWVVDDGTMSVGSGNITTNNAAITLSGANASFAQLGGLASNKGELVITGGARFDTQTSLSNTGTLVVEANSAYLGNGATSKLTDLNNAGQLTIGDGARVGGLNQFTQTAGITELRGGVLAAQSVQFLGGKLVGSGTIDPPSPIVIGADAVVSPDGTLIFEGDTQFDGLLDIRISALDDFSRLYIFGDITFGLGSKIQISFDPGFVMLESSFSFDFLGASGLMAGLEDTQFLLAGLDNFDSQLQSNCDIGGCSYSLLLSGDGTNNPVPEPGTLPLALLSFAALALSRRRSRHALSKFC